MKVGPRRLSVILFFLPGTRTGASEEFASVREPFTRMLLGTSRGLSFLLATAGIPGPSFQQVQQIPEDQIASSTTLAPRKRRGFSMTGFRRNLSRRLSFAISFEIW
jgi:hypothetical protein